MKVILHILKSVSIVPAEPLHEAETPSPQGSRQRYPRVTQPQKNWWKHIRENLSPQPSMITHHLSFSSCPFGGHFSLSCTPHTKESTISWVCRISKAYFNIENR